MKLRWLLAWLMCCQLAQAQPLAASATPEAPAALRIGVLPYLSARTLLLEYAPLREFLAQELHAQVQVLTAPDLPRFLARTQEGAYDLAITAPHFARLAQQDHGFTPLIAIRADFYALLLVPRNDPARTLADLRGKTLHLPHRLAFISLQIEDFLRERGVDPRRDLRLFHHKTDNNAILAVEKGGDDAAAAQRSVFDTMPHEITDRLRILGSTQSALSLIVLAHPRLAPARRNALQSALERFPYSEPGLKFFAASHSEFVPATPATMLRLDAYMAPLKQRLAELPP